VAVLKINLLPPYIYERRKTRKVILAFSALFVAIVFALLTWWISISNKQKDLETRVAEAEMRAQQVLAIEQQRDVEKAKLPTIKAKVDFMDALMAYNLEAPKLYEEIAKYTYGRVRLLSIQPSGGNQVTIQAHARTLGDCGRYLMNLYRAQHIFSSVTISGVPTGWPPGSASSGSPGGPIQQPIASQISQPTVQSPQEPGFDFTVTCTLVKPIVPPTYGGGQGSAEAGAMPAGGMTPATSPTPLSPPAPSPTPAPSGGPINP
jgi:hypothetical protein